MSGQPYKNQADMNKKRNEYMENLREQEEINEMNLQANKNYLLTGQLPTQSQTIDTRTTSEKLKDVENMKQNIASDFIGILDTTASYSLVNKILESPLNLNNSLFRFFAQRSKSIAETFKTIYNYGSEGDANDIQRIYEYIKNMYSDTQGKFQTTKSYMNSLSVNGTNKILSSNDLSTVIVQINDIIKNIFNMITKTNNPLLQGANNELSTLRDILNIFINQIPTTEEFDNIINRFNTMDDATAANNNLRQNYEFFISIMEKLPKYSEVIALCNKIKQYLESNSIDTVIDGINRLVNLFGLLFDRDNQRRLQMVNNTITQPERANTNLTNQYQTVKSIQDIQNMQQQQDYAEKAQKVFIVNPDTNPIPIRGRGRPRGSGISVKEKKLVERKPMFIGFGINEINHKKLDKGLVKIRRISKSNYMDMPTKRVSSNLQGIIKTISGGGVPNYNDLGKLDDDEKNYLNEIVKRSELSDKLSIPAPSKDQEEKDIHNFEVMKGQLMSGNDSAIMVKKFKILIRKLTKQNLLPKKDVEELNDLLFDLGY